MKPTSIGWATELAVAWAAWVCLGMSSGAMASDAVLAEYQSGLLPATVEIADGVESADELARVMVNLHARASQAKWLAPTHLCFVVEGSTVVKPFSKFDPAAMSEPWVLLLSDTGSRYDWAPYGQRGGERGSEQPAGLPQLLVFSRRPKALAFSAERGVSASLSQRGTIASLSLFGRTPIRQEQVRRVVEGRGLPEAWIERSRTWAKLLLHRPVRAVETSAIEGDDLRLTQRFSHEATPCDWDGWNDTKYAPVPTTLALAMAWGGYPAQLSPSSRDVSHATAFGPVTLVAGDHWSVRLPGVVKYVRQRPRYQLPAGLPEPIEAIRDRLENEVRRTVESGTLAPVKYFYGEAWTTHYFDTPLEFYGPWSTIVQALDGPTRAQAVAYIQEHARKYPPTDSHRRQPLGEGLRREFESGHATSGGVHGHQHAIRAYHAAAAADAWLVATDQVLAADTHQAVVQVLDSMRSTPGALDWAHWSIPAHRGRELPEVRFIHNGPHVLTRGLIAAARLAEGEQRDRYTAAACKTLVAHATYPALLGAYDVGRGRDSWKPAGQSVQFWYAVPRVTAEAPVSPGRYWAGNAQYQALSYLSPRIARFWKATPNAMQVVPAVEPMYQWAPDWFVTDGEPWFHIAEMSRQPPDCAWSMFNAQALLLDATPKQLARWTDVPFCRIGDLYHMQKLAYTVLSAGQVHWESAD